MPKRRFSPPPETPDNGRPPHFTPQRNLPHAPAPPEVRGGDDKSLEEMARANPRAARAANDAIQELEHVLGQHEGMPKHDETPLTADQIKQREIEAQHKEDYERGLRPDAPTHTVPESEQLGRGYNPGGEKGKEKRSFRDRLRRRKRALLIGGAFSALGAVGGLLMMSVLPFQLNHVMENMNARTFARLQGVSTEGRSTKWVQAYMTARLLDIENPEENNKMDDNILFRADRVDNNKPWSDWYRTIRTSRFEKDVFETHGFKFASMARREGNKIVIRVAKITVKDTELSFDPFDGPNAIDAETLEAATNGDIAALERIDRLTGKLDEFIHTEFFDNKEGRKELKKAMREVMQINGWKWWNGVKRYHIRKDIQNMTGITSWVFFETTRQKLKENYIGARNKMLSKALPANAKSGKFMRCMFGIDSCRASTDPYSPDNKNLPNAGRNTGGDKTDSQGNPVENGAANLEPGLKPDAELSDFSKKIARELIKRGGLAVGVVGLISALAIFDENVNNGSFSTIVEVARGQQLAGLYTQFDIANSQLRTGEVVGEEVDETMEMISNTTNNEAWETVVNERPNTVLAAGEFVPASNKKEFCSEEHQEAMKRPENYVQASNEFVYNCPGDQIGAVTNAALFEESWNNGVGAVLHPILTVWRNSIGFIVDIFNDIVDAVLGPVLDGILSALGLDKKIEELMGWLGEKALAFSGAGPMWDALTFPGKIVNLVFQGGAYVAEGAARGQGAAQTTPQMEQETTDRYTSGMLQRRADSSLYQRYLSLEEPDSVAANALFALTNRSPGSMGQRALGSIGSILTLPLTLISQTVHAADPGVGSPYTAARKLAAIETFDFPVARCIDRPVIGTQPRVVGSGPNGKVYGNGASGDGLKESMTPQNATNAADPDIGIFKPEELSWDLMQNKDRWYAELYNRVGTDDSKAKKVWNCALLDNAVAGGLGGLYGYQGVGALSSGQTILK